jgi:hypothetical protein
MSDTAMHCAESCPNDLQGKTASQQTPHFPHRRLNHDRIISPTRKGTCVTYIHAHALSCMSTTHCRLTHQAHTSKLSRCPFCV